MQEFTALKVFVFTEKSRGFSAKCAFFYFFFFLLLAVDKGHRRPRHVLLLACLLASARIRTPMPSPSLPLPSPSPRPSSLSLAREFELPKETLTATAAVLPSNRRPPTPPRAPPCCLEGLPRPPLSSGASEPCWEGPRTKNTAAALNAAAGARA